jgi:transposase
MAHRGQWSEHEARGVLNAWRRSGQSLERFAKERGLVPQRVRWWKTFASCSTIVGTKRHLRLRRARAGPVRDTLHEWLLREKPRHPPKSPIGTAIRYAMNQRRELGRFLDDARVPLDNNASEASLRRVALGRKNFLFVGDVHAGMSIAGLYTLVATYEARGINPFAYLADVIPRVQDHPKRRLDELLPGPWARAQAYR